MVVKVLRSISEIREGEWDRIVGRNRLICRHAYLRAVEACRINDCRYYYPLVIDAEGIAAHGCVYFISTALDSFAGGPLKRAISRLRRAWPGFLILRSVECGTPVALGSTISFRAGADTEAAFRLIVAATERLTRESGANVVLIRDFVESEIGFCDDCLRDRGYTQVRNLPCARLELRWDSFADYVGSLRSRYRNKLAARINRFEAAGGRLELVREFSGAAVELARLWRNCYDRATEYRREVLGPDFFENMDGLGRRSAVIVARIDGGMAGFMLLLYDDETLIPLFAGLDYDLSEEYSVYFNLFYRTIAEAIDAGMKEIDFGITSIVPKAELGARVVPLYMYMKHMNPRLNAVVPRAFRALTPRFEDGEKRVFRREVV